MTVTTKSKAQLIEEIEQLRQQVAELEESTSVATSLEQNISQAIIDTSPAFFVIIDFEGKTKMMNKSMLAALGYSGEEVQGKDYISTFVPERERDSLSKLFEKEIFKGKSTTNQNHVLTKDGHELFCEWQGQPLPNPKGKIDLFCGVGLDITEHQQTEEAYRILVESSLQALVIIQDGSIVFGNHAAEVVTGYTVKELMEMTSPIQILVHPQDLPERLERTAQFARGEDIPPITTYRIVDKKGQVHWVETYTTRIEWRRKPATHTTFIDITERKLAEDELQRTSQDENKRREELEKLREVSTNMRQAEGSSELLQVFTKEVQRLCQADVAASILFKANQEPVILLSPKENIELNKEQLDAINGALLIAKTGELITSLPGLGSILILQLQSPDAIHGAALVASQTSGAFSADEHNMAIAIADMAGTALNRIDILETLEERVQQRTRNLVVLYNLITIISENWRLQDLLELSLVLTLETVKADHGIIYLSDGKDEPGIKPVIQRGFADGFQIKKGRLPDDMLAREVFKKQKPLSLNNLSEDPAFANFKGLNSYAGIPILARGSTRGVFSLFSNSKESFDTEEMALLASIADHLGIGIENSILYEQSRENAALEERNRLARDLHDSVSQLLYSLTLMAGTTKKMLERGSSIDAVKNSVERLGDTAHRALKEMRLLLFELRPAVLESEGLLGALQHRIKTVEEGLGMSVDLQVEELPELPNYVEDALYHIAMEAFNNIVKHSESTVASLKFTIQDDTLVMEISDNGKGFDTDLLQRGLGLRNMRERGQMLNSEVIIYSKIGEGTRVTVEAKLPSSSLLSSR